MHSYKKEAPEVFLVNKESENSIIRNVFANQNNVTYYNTKFYPRDYIFIQENQKNAGDTTLPFQILENDLYKSLPISKNEAMYRAYYFLIINGHSWGYDKTSNNNFFFDVYCKDYLLNGARRKACNFFDTKLNHIDIYNLNNVTQEALKNNDLLNIRKYALLGQTLASDYLVNYYKNQCKDYTFWLWISAENGNKQAQEELGELMLSDTITDQELMILHLNEDEKDLRGQFWLNKAKEQ